MLGYFLKALFETFFEKREERLRSKEGIHEDSVDTVSYTHLDVYKRQPEINPPVEDKNVETE